MGRQPSASRRQGKKSVFWRIQTRTLKHSSITRRSTNRQKKSESKRKGDRRSGSLSTRSQTSFIFLNWAQVIFFAQENEIFPPPQIYSMNPCLVMLLINAFLWILCKGIVRKEWYTLQTWTVHVLQIAKNLKIRRWDSYKQPNCWIMNYLKPFINQLLIIY